MIAIIQYNAGNIQSVANALQRLDCTYKVTDDAAEIKAATKVILPGVGEAGSAMSYLKAKGLDQLLPTLRQPVLGICLGLQLMCRRSEEGATEGMGIFDTTVVRFPPKERVPHMGWNNMKDLKSALFQDISTEDDVYFVHSYYAKLCPQTIAVTDYTQPFSAALQKDNFYAVQFHPEKSALNGQKILQNFLAL